MCFFRIFLAVSIFLCTAKLPAQLSGAYTIGGSSPNYPTINAAVSALLMQGVSGPVIFNIQDGIYLEQLAIGTVMGTSLVNTITFQSESSDSTAVIITFEADSSNNFTLQLDSASFLIFKEITFKAAGLNYNQVVVITNGSPWRNYG